MIIRDITRHSVLSKNAKIAVSFLDRLLGLLDQRNPRFLIFQTRFGIHTFLMADPIDVILLDDRQKIVKSKRGLRPNRLFVYKPRYKTVIEMPAGTIDKYRIAINDKISIA